MHDVYQIPEVAPVLTVARGTLGFKRDMLPAYAWVPARDIEVRIAPYAQYQAAVYVTFIPKGKRARRTLVGTDRAALLVLDGQDPISEPPDYRKGVRSTDPVWAEAARAAARVSGRLLADYHEHDALRG